MTSLSLKKEDLMNRQGFKRETLTYLVRRQRKRNDTAKNTSLV